ncbi:hypothetical protein SAMN05446037_102937 [Anaerovirgula multivorans]|uniref:Uncharacterized protein n=1 Tax=Anaerovirgula multivorans TaxID=312168 RepID=A0A239IPF7_9FIRM|nr:hypothetical protein [Anaerovirgula multivorans]SNS95465.1 hypothetical protein SAMN05446037_102937 [Anaerovirgula multivorans]
MSILSHKLNTENGFIILAKVSMSAEVYHIMARGINCQNIFEDGEDYMKFIDTVQKNKEKSGFEL